MLTQCDPHFWTTTNWTINGHQSISLCGGEKEIQYLTLLGIFNVVAYKPGHVLPYCPGYRGSSIGKIHQDEAGTREK